MDKYKLKFNYCETILTVITYYIVNCFGVMEGMDETCDEQVYFDHHKFDIEMVQEIEARIILHWNYRNLREIPREVLEYGLHLREMYLKRNLIQTLVSGIRAKIR
jgi:hypothetical protein